MVIDRNGEDYLYTNLDDWDLIHTGGMARDVDYFLGKLQEMGLSVPESMIQDIRHDAVMNIGNLIKDHTST